jgi:ATP-dependent protease ClpP protease subunit
MGKPGSALHMRANKNADRSPSWFRIENAHVDEEAADDETTPIYIYDVIGDSWWEDATPANEFVKQLSAIKTPNIELHLNSPGGDIFDGVAIYNALKAHPARVTVIVDALAASAASFIAQAGDEVIMTKAATMMIHDGSGLVWGNAADMRKTADLLDQLSDTVAEIYADRAGQSIEFWRDLMIEETWYNSHEAVKSGLADKIGEDTKKEDDEAAQNRWDLSIFNHAGRGSAPDPLQVRQRIANRLKEKTVGQPQNTSGAPEEETPPTGTPETTHPASPETDPDADTTQGDAGAVQEDEEAQQGVVAPENPAGTQENAAQVAFTNKGATAQPVFTVGGQSTTDYSAVQNHVNSLESFRNDTIKAAKVQFVKDLAADNKIMAPQIEKLTNYALSLTDDQYSAWKDTWEGSSPHAMLGQGHGGAGTTNHDGPQSHGAENVDNELNTCKGIIKQHKLGGMKNEQIMQTQSYKRLMELEPTFKL